MRKNAFVALNHIVPLNEFRANSIKHEDLPLSEEDFRNAFKACGIPSNALFFLEFRRAGLLVRVEGDMYAWKNNLPIHHQTLQGIYTRYQKKVNEYSNARYARKKREKALKSKEIEDAINLLKENGFEVLAPKGNLYQKLQWYILKVVKIVVIWFSPDYLLSLLSYSN